MTWFRLDDGFHSHPKVEALADGDLYAEAVALYALAGTWASQHLTDGRVPRGKVRRLGMPIDAAEALVAVGLWDRDEEGYRFHDWEEWNPTRDEVEDRRQKDRQRKAEWRAKKAAKKARAGGSQRASARDTSDVTPDATKESQRDSGGGHAVTSANVPSDPRDRGGTPTRVPVSHAGQTAESQRDISECHNGTSAKETRDSALPDPARPDPVNPPPSSSGRARGPTTTTSGVVHLDSERLPLMATKAYRAAIEGDGGIYDGHAGDRSVMARIGHLAATYAERRGEPVVEVLQGWAKRYVSERQKRAPRWWLERVQIWVAEGGAAPIPGSEASAEAAYEAEWDRMEARIVLLESTGRSAEARKIRDARELMRQRFYGSKGAS